MRRKQYARLLFGMASIICFALGMGAKHLYKSLKYVFLLKLSVVSIRLTMILVITILAEWLLSNRIYKGVRYFVRYITVMNSLELQMIDAGLFIERGNIIELSQIRLSFDKGLSKGILRIRNSLKFNKKFDDIVMSSALGRYIVERHYLTDDANFYVYELMDGSVDFKLHFKSYAEYVEYCKGISTYFFFLIAVAL